MIGDTYNRLFGDGDKGNYNNYNINTNNNNIYDIIASTVR